MKKIILIIILLLGFLKGQSQDIDLSKSHNFVEYPIYVLDYMEIDSSMLYSIKLAEKDINNIIHLLKSFCLPDDGQRCLWTYQHRTSCQR
jgi:hypothetical protein